MDFLIREFQLHKREQFYTSSCTKSLQFNFHISRQMFPVSPKKCTQNVKTLKFDPHLRSENFQGYKHTRERQTIQAAVTLSETYLWLLSQLSSNQIKKLSLQFCWLYWKRKKVLQKRLFFQKIRFWRLWFECISVVARFSGISFDALNSLEEEVDCFYGS